MAGTGGAKRVGVGAGRPRGAAERHGALLAGRTFSGTRQRSSAVFGPETIIGRAGEDSLARLMAAGDFGYGDPDEPTARGRIVAVRADGPGGATRVRRMAVESGRRVPRAAHPGWRGIEVTRANETMLRAVGVFVRRAV